MTNTRSTKRALLASFMALLLCFSMLLSTTFAWFTDSVTSGNNIIQSGNLDIELEYWNGTDWADVKDASDILTNTLWEPGVTEVAYLRVANAGSLALKYQMGINIVSEKAGKNAAGETFKLSDYIMFGVKAISADADKKPATYDTREDAVAAVTGAKKISAGYTKADSMTAGQELYLALVVYMPTTVGNVANHDGTNVPEINLGINILATQYTYEEDSFGEDYDKGAPWTGLVDIDWYLDNPDATEYVLTSGEELAGLAAIVNGTAVAPVTTYAVGENTAIKDNFKGKTIKLGGNIDLNDIEWTPIGDNPNPFLGDFDGESYTVSNLYVSNEGWAGLIGHAGKSAGSTIKNVTINGVTILSNRMAGAVVGQLYGSIDNCHVKNATIMVTPNAVGDSYDNGDKVGGIVGWLGDNGNNRVLSNCTATQVELGAYRDVGGIVGYVASSTTVKGNTVKDVKITVDQITNNYGEKDVNAGYVYGRVNGTITEENNTAVDSNVDSTYSKNGLTMKADGEGEVTLYLVPETYEGTTVNVPEGVTTIGNYAFAYNSNVETVVLSSTVRDLGRGFDSSTVKKVVLNEGLETISSRAFRSTTALEEVVFSSTITEIADNAFQKSGIKEIVIPASVKTIGEAAFGSSLIETVTFEGDIAIQGYAFRGCTKLSTVNMNGYNVTFIASTLNNRNSCWFCNGESNNPNTSNITFNVKTDVIKDRVLAAMGAEKNNTPVNVKMTAEQGGYYLDAAGNAIVYDANGLVAALEAKKDNGIKAVILAEGDYALRFTNNTNFNLNDMTIKGLGNVNLSISSSEAWYGRVQGSNVTFENIHFTSSVGATGKATYNNCTFDSWAICASSNNEETTFNNCTINGCLNTSTDFSSGDVFVNNCKIAKAEYSGSMTMNFVDCQIDEIIIWNANTNLTNCEVTKLDVSNVTNATVTIE